MAYFGKGISATSGNLKSGFRQVEKNLKIELAKIKNKTNKGLILSAVEVRRNMESSPPLIPVDLGNLKASWFIVTKNDVFAEVKQMEVKGGKFSSATPPKILAQLKEAHTTVIEQSKKGLSKVDIGVVMGFSAFYAAAVHEKLGENVKWSVPGSGPKFFQAALYRSTPKILSIVKQTAKF